MHKKTCIAFFTILLLLSLWSPSLADEVHNVHDYLNYLTTDEITSLQNRIDDFKTDHKLDVVIVITDDTSGKSSRDFADDFYDYGGYGVDDKYSGLLLLINMDIREVWISTTGRAINMFTDARIDKTLDRVAPHLTGGHYYQACNAFLDKIDDYRPKVYSERMVNMMLSPIVYIIAAILGVIITLMASKTSRGKITTDKLTYEDSGCFNLKEQKDLFVRQTTSRVRIESSSSGGGSSTHRGSSGRSHGGGGRSF